MYHLERSFMRLFKSQKLNCFLCAVLRKNDTILRSHQRNVHISPNSFTIKKHKGIENEFMFQFISRNGPCLPVSSKIREVDTMGKFEDLLNENYRKNSDYSATDILNIFKSLQTFCCQNQIDISDARFDNLVDGLMDHCRELTDSELLEFVHLLNRYPRCVSYKEHNFHDVWSCLDDMSRERLSNKKTDYLLKLANAWYELDLGRIGQYVFELIDVLCKRSHQLTKDQVVKAFFFINVCRRKPVPFELEQVVNKYLKELSIDELGIIALGYFKSKSKIKFEHILLTMMVAIEKECSTVNQITLSSILKIIRFSNIGNIIRELDKMLDVLVGDIERFSAQCCLHIAIIGSGAIHYHEKSMVRATQRILDKIGNVEEVRLKDIERLLVASTMVDYRPKVCPDLFDAAFKEIHEPRRQAELVSFPRLLPCILGCLGMVNMYSYELMDKILDREYIFDTYGKNFGNIGREIFTLDCCIDIECPDYRGNRLPPNLKYRLVKWLTEFIPIRNQEKKLTAYDQLHLDVIDNLIYIVGNKDAVKVDFVAPHFSRADIILCKNKTTNKFIEPPGFQQYVFGDVMYALKDPNLDWYALSIIGWNNTIRNTSHPVGMVTMKQRHLNKLGYNSRLVIWNQYMNLSKDSKMNYIHSLLS